MKKDILVPPAAGCEEIELVTIVGLLRRAGAVVTVAAVGVERVVGSHGVKIAADKPLPECMNRHFDLIA